MNLRERAEADNAFLIEDDVTGFAVGIKLTEPNLSVSVAAVLQISVGGIDDTVLAANLRWKIGDSYYRQNNLATIAGGIATINVTAEISGSAGNQAIGTVLSVLPLAELTNATVQSVIVAGTDSDPDIVHHVKGIYRRIGVDVDPETGLLVPGTKSSATVRLSRFNLANLPDKGWTIETTDISGASVKGFPVHVLIDRTLGRITIVFKR